MGRVISYLRIWGWLRRNNCTEVGMILSINSLTPLWSDEAISSHCLQFGRVLACSARALHFIGNATSRNDSVSPCHSRNYIINSKASVIVHNTETMLANALSHILQAYIYLQWVVILSPSEAPAKFDRTRFLKASRTHTLLPLCDRFQSKSSDSKKLPSLGPSQKVCGW